MENLSRRELCVALSAFLAVSGASLEAQPAGGDPLAHSRVFDFNELHVNHMANGGESRQIVHGTLATGERVTLHESMQPAGLPPNPAHRIEHTEFIFVQSGTMAFEHDGKTEQAGPGSVLYVAKGTLHAVRNVGKDVARYFVVAIGGDVKG